MGEDLKEISGQLQLMGDVSLGGGSQTDIRTVTTLGGGAQADIRTVTTHGGGESWGRVSNRYLDSYNSWGR